MVHAAVVPSRMSTRRLIDALHRKTAGGAGRSRAATRGGQEPSRLSRTARPNGDPPSVTLWGEDE